MVDGSGFRVQGSGFRVQGSDGSDRSDRSDLNCRQRVFTYCSGEFIDQAGSVTGAEAVVDIDDRDTAGAAGEHTKEGGDTAEISTIADTGGHSDNGFVDQAGDNTGESAFHTGSDNTDAGISN